jgi:iron complex transport system substrate-binding protein
LPLPSHPATDSGFGRLPAYSGATVPALHRLPAQTPPPELRKGWWLPSSEAVPAVRPILASVIACAALLYACTSHPNATGSGSSAAGGARRIVTLVPSFADDVYAIGAGSQLVGVSSFTDAPQAKGLPRVADASNVDAEAIVALRPSVVIGIPAQARLTAALTHARVRVVLLADDSFASIFDNLETIGALSGHSVEAKRTIARLRRETAALHARTAGYVRRPSVFIVLGSGPIWTAGADSYITTLIALAGGTNAAGDLHAAYAQYSAEALLRRQPDVLVADAALHLDAMTDREPWRSLRAVRLGHVYPVDPDLIERPGPSYNDGVRWLIDRLTPLATATP